MDCRAKFSWLLLVPMAALAAGCNSPYRADQGALFGGLAGAGVGAIVGNAVGNTGAGAAIGAATGMITGAAVGGELDEIEARNRAEIEQRMGRPVSAGAVTIADVVAMSQAGVDDELIVSHIRGNGMAAPLVSTDLIYLQQQGVSSRVMQTMQEPPARPVVVREARVAQPVIIEEHYYDPWGPHYYHGHHHRHRYRHRPSHVSWGVSVGH